MRAEIGAAAKGFRTEDEYLAGIAEFLQEVIDDPSGYLESCGLDDEVKSERVRETVKGVLRHVTSTLATPRIDRGRLHLSNATLAEPVATAQRAHEPAIPHGAIRSTWPCQTRRFGLPGPVAWLTSDVRRNSKCIRHTAPHCGKSAIPSAHGFTQVDGIAVGSQKVSRFDARTTASAVAWERCRSRSSEHLRLPWGEPRFGPHCLTVLFGSWDVARS